VKLTQAALYTKGRMLNTRAARERNNKTETMLTNSSNAGNVKTTADSIQLGDKNLAESLIK